MPRGIWTVTHTDRMPGEEEAEVRVLLLRRTPETVGKSRNLGERQQAVPAWPSEDTAPPTPWTPPLGGDTAHPRGLSHLVCAPLSQCPCK